MHKLLTLLAVVFLISSCSNQKIHYPNKPQPLTHMGRSTVALMADGKDGAPIAYCTGVFVREDTILTASHCMEGFAEHLSTDDKKFDLIGLPVVYAVEEDIVGVGKAPRHVYDGISVKVDKDHDLALILVNGKVPAHEVATLARELPYIGEKLYFLGHTVGLYFTYSQGLVAAYRDSLPGDDRTLSYMQAVAPSVSFGNSGGGAFNSDGQLVGIAESINQRATSVAFYVPLDVIHTFLYPTPAKP